jgi:hypothetical protein
MVRTPVHLLVEGLVKQLNTQNLPAYITKRGEKMDGVVFLKIVDGAGQAKLKTRQRDLDGDLSWVDVLAQDIAPEAEADQYLIKAKDFDPDLWIVEVEDIGFKTGFDPAALYEQPGIL